MVETSNQTTIKVSPATRDRIKLLGQGSRQSADEVVGAALDALEDRDYWQAFADAHAARTAKQIAEDDAEDALWDSTSADDAGRA